MRATPYTQNAPLKRAAAALLAVLATLALAAPVRAASEVFIRGAGYGHGVGMSQWGAYGYALHGWDYHSILAHYYTGTSLGTTNPHQLVTVLITTRGGAFTGATQAGGKKLAPTRTYEVHALANGQLRLVTRDGERVATFSPPLTATGPGPLTVPGRGAYRGVLVFRPTASGRVETINAVGLDDYVRGVVAAEMPSGWPVQALEAQAVAARTYAITTDAGGSDFEQYPDTRSQVYGGVGAEAPRSDAAVAATRGQVVTYAGSPVVAYFFSSSGGYTENDEYVWPGSPPDPWLRGVRDPYDGAGGNPYHRWLVELSGARAASKLRSVLDGGFVGITVLERGVSPRIANAELVGTRGTREVTGAQLEQRLGLDSTWAAFTTITTVASAYESGSPSASAGAAEMAMPLSLVRALITHVAPVPKLAGTALPGPAGARIAVQVLTSHGVWRTIRHTNLRSGGSYSVRPPYHGTYRIVYDGLQGPAVAL